MQDHRTLHIADLPSLLFRGAPGADASADVVEIGLEADFPVHGNGVQALARDADGFADGAVGVIIGPVPGQDAQSEAFRIVSDGPFG